MSDLTSPRDLTATRTLHRLLVRSDKYMRTNTDQMNTFYREQSFSSAKAEGVFQTSSGNGEQDTDDHKTLWRTGPSKGAYFASVLLIPGFPCEMHADFAKAASRTSAPARRWLAPAYCEFLLLHQ